MAVNPVQFLVASNASILDGTKTITISGGVNASRVFSGTAVFLGGADNPAEAVSGTAPDGSGISTITLRNNWTQGDVSNQSLVAFNTNEGLAEAISNVREIVSNASALEDLATEGLVKRIDDNNYEVVNITSLGESLVGANDSGTARSVLALGSAATKNVGTSSGNVMEVGAFGLGLTDASPWPRSTLNDVSSMPSAIYGGYLPSISTSDGWPINASAVNYTLQHYVERESSGVQILQFQRINSGMTNTIFMRNFYNGGFSGWQELYHNGNSVNPLDYGLGLSNTSNAPAMGDLNTAPSGLLRTNNSGTLNTPDGSGFWTILSQNYSGETGTQLAMGIGGKQIWYRGNPNSVWSDWKEIYHSGNSVNPLDYGLGVSGQSPSVSNLDAQQETGLFRIADSNAVGLPEVFLGTMYQNNRADIRRNQLIHNELEMFFRGETSEGFAEWKKVYHSGNTNFNEFGFAGFGRSILQGVATSSTSVRLFNSLSSQTFPTGITTQGSFRIVDDTGTIVISGIESWELTYASASSERLLVINIFNLSGLIEGNSYELQCESNSPSSQITVNF